MLFSNCACDVSFRKNMRLSRKVVEKLFQNRHYGVTNCWGGTPDFGRALQICMVYFPTCGKVWLSSVQ